MVSPLRLMTRKTAPGTSVEGDAVAVSRSLMASVAAVGVMDAIVIFF